MYGTHVGALCVGCSSVFGYVQAHMAEHSLTCGHTFCQPCLDAWFSKIHTNFTQQNPEFSELDSCLNNLREEMNRPGLTTEDIRCLSFEMWTLMRRDLPKYTCPGCRATIHHKPHHVYALKTVAGAVAAAHGDSIEEEGSNILGRYFYVD